MTTPRQNIIPVYIEDEMKSSYIDYSMSVIVSRALPDVRDGMKPVHRRILYAMDDLGLASNRSHKKSARVVGEVLGKYHPHGDTAVYDAMVRMVQEFSLRYPMIDGQGNFGSVDGDSAAAMRYTEVRLSPMGEEMLSDLAKETVDFAPNFDNSLQEPLVLPSPLPNLLVNGASGIAVGMATNIPPHNIGEVVDGIVALIEDPEIEIDELMEFIKGPDFPTGGVITGASGIREAYRTGRGRVIQRAFAKVETQKSGRESIVVSEIPFQVNKSNLLAKIAELVREKRVEGISDLRDESDREGMRVVIDLRKGVNPEVVLNQLYKHTQMQETFGVIMLTLVGGRPQVLNLKEVLQRFVEHRHEVVVRRTKFDLKKAEQRAHILEGLKIALDHIDEIVALIKKSKDPDTARQGLMKRFDLSKVQAQAILDMRLQRLTGLERRKIEEEYLQLIKEIARLKGILESQVHRMALIKEELLSLKEKFSDERRTTIIDEEQGEFTLEDLIAEEDMVITISHTGYIKRLPTSTYRRQRRGGRGVTGMGTKEEDFVEHLFIASTHDYILFFTDRGRCYWLKVHWIPQGGRMAKGRAVANLLKIQPGESIAAFVPVKFFDDEHYVITATRKGIIKKTLLAKYSHPRKGGICGALVDEDDELIEAKLTDGNQDIILGTRKGKAIRFPESDVRCMGRSSRGVKGITLGKGDWLVGMVVVKRGATLLVVSENGYGKRSNISDYPLQHRGGKGVITIKNTARNGDVVTIKETVETDELMIITQGGVVIRLPIRGVSVIGRNTQGVKLINLDEGDKVVDVARVVSEEE
ncbi:MAG: DNA gyrase subunit A [candidate division Zixibacteria bacterium SM23_81]|nr:MAG: DNA gyrase subunit A [candidate division Zixibacteria bacterium SM23_81]